MQSPSEMDRLNQSKIPPHPHPNAGEASGWFEQKEQFNRQAMEGTLTDLAAILSPQHTSSVPQIAMSIDNPDRQLLLVAGMVGKVLGIKICPPAKSEDLNRVQSPIEAIARASKVRLRRVTLRDDWWQRDGGPILSSTLADNRPVALLPISGSRYELLDPLTLVRTPVDGHLAERIAPIGYTFYRPLPLLLTTQSLLQFAVRGQGKELSIVLGTGLVGALLGMLTPQATSILIDSAIPDADRGLLIQIALGLLATAVGSTLFQLTQGIALMRLDAFANSSIQAGVWDRLLNLRVSFFRQYSIGDLNSRVTAISQIHQKLSNTVLKTIFSSLFSLLNLGLLFFYSSQLATIAVVVALVHIVVTIVSGILKLRQVRPLLENQGKLFGVVVQLIQGTTKIRVAGAESRAFAYWGQEYRHQLQLILRAQGIEDSLAAIDKILPAITTAALFWFAITLLKQSQPGGGLSTGSFLAFNAAFGTFIGGASSLSSTVVDVLEVLPLWKRAAPILNALPEVDANKTDPGRLVGKLIVDHVMFRYRDDGPFILDDVSFQVEPGEFIALVGPSGSGKSTLFRLLLGFDLPAAGTIYYDGQDLAGLNVNAVRRQLGTVLQNSRLMSASLFENIASGATISMDEAWEAAQMAGFAADIEAMPMGMHTLISEGGTNLSGGQRQRLLITRSLVLKPKILLFDEATSALDNRTQSIVSQSLEQLKVTRIAIAHRLSTIYNADRIYVLDAGRIVQQGTFAELANQAGLFAQLIAHQTI
jgi:NHLM bacteriocin system ABC transporter ATP-binding protein